MAKNAALELRIGPKACSARCVSVLGLIVILKVSNSAQFAIIIDGADFKWVRSRRAD